MNQPTIILHSAPTLHELHERARAEGLVYLGNPTAGYYCASGIRAEFWSVMARQPDDAPGKVVASSVHRPNENHHYSAAVSGDTIALDLEYPRNRPVKAVQIGLMDVRAADSIRIEYDFERDGWRILQAQVFSWAHDDKVCDPLWTEVAFVQAWGSQVPGAMDLMDEPPKEPGDYWFKGDLLLGNGTVFERVESWQKISVAWNGEGERRCLLAAVVLFDGGVLLAVPFFQGQWASDPM